MATIHDRSALGAAPASGDILTVSDVSDTTDSANGTDKKMTVDNLDDFLKSSTKTLTNKTISLTNNTISGTKAEFNTAVSDGTIQFVLAEGAFVDGDKTKLDGIETGADVTDTTNVTAAGALMDSEVDADIKTLALPANTTISAFGATLIDDADAATARTTLGVDAAGTDNSTDVTLAGTPDYITITGQQITRNQIDLTTDVTGVLPEANLPNASTTAEGVVEVATSAEINTGTDTARSISPDSLAGSNFGIRYVSVLVFDYATDTATGDGKAYFHIPSGMDGMNLISVHAEVFTAGTTGTTDIQIHNVDNALDMLSTKLTIDSAETGSDTAATAAVINTSNDHVNTNDVIRIDVDAVSTTAAKGLLVTMGFQLG